MKELIYNQTRIPKEKWRYGLRSSAAVGCGWIATHNALRLLGYETDIEELIRWYEWQLPLLHGNTGTSFWGPAIRFQLWGFPVETSICPARFDALVDSSDVCILFYHWRKGVKLGAHFVALHKRNGRITGYNTYRTSTGPDDYGESLEAFVKKQGLFGAFFLGIKDKRN